MLRANALQQCSSGFPRPEGFVHEEVGVALDELRPGDWPKLRPRGVEHHRVDELPEVPVPFAAAWMTAASSWRRKPRSLNTRSDGINDADRRVSSRFAFERFSCWLALK